MAVVSRSLVPLNEKWGKSRKPEYQKRVDDFFAFTDRNNCKRVYEAILEAAREDAKEED